jgi:glycosyltransferase involved in cell wall biosynthesis
MRCPTLSELPLSPPGKTGWPWTEESPQLPDLTPDGSEWPRISIVTPNYNYGHFIEETIRSVLLQGYSNLEYIIIDGASTDNSMKIVKKYEKWLSCWISEKDCGQTNAINKGIKESNGIIFNWINSDDTLSRGALSTVSNLYVQSKFDILIGRCQPVEIEDSNNKNQTYSNRTPSKSITYWDLIERTSCIDQPSVFLNCYLLKSLGCLRENLHYVMDYELYLRMLLQANSHPKVMTSDKLLSIAKMHSDAKTATSWNLFEIEMIEVIKENLSFIPRNESKRVNQTLRQLKIQTSVRESTNTRHPLLYLLSLPLKYPATILSEFYLGAIKANLLKSLQY